MTKFLTNKNFDKEVAEGIVLVDMGAEWCGPCKMVAPIINELSEELTDVKVFKVDLDSSPEIGKRFNVKSIPTFLILKDGKLVEKVVGANTKKQFYLDLIENVK